MGIQVQAVASCTGCVFVLAGSAIYDKRQEQTGNWTPFEPTDRDGRWPSVGQIISAATYQNPEGSVGYVAVVGVDGQLYIGAPTWGISGPELTPALPPMRAETISSTLATESYIVYLSSDFTQIVLIDFAQVLGIVPFTNSAYKVLQAPEPLQVEIGAIAAAKNSEGQWEICGPIGAGAEIGQLAVDSASVRWSNIPLDFGQFPFGLYLCGEILYMFLTDQEQIWVKRQVPLRLGIGREPEYLWEAAHLLNPPPVSLSEFQPATVIVAPGNYFMLFTIDNDGGLWRSQYDGTLNPNIWEYVGWPPGVNSLRPNSLAVSIGTTGNIELFAASDEGDLWQMWHTTETGVWSAWYFHGSP
jgi:hypothetical protein